MEQLTATTRTDFSNLSIKMAATTQHSKASEESANHASELLTTAKMAISQFDIDSAALLSTFATTLEAKLLECDTQMRRDHKIVKLLSSGMLELLSRQ